MPGRTPKRLERKKRPEKETEYLTILISHEGKPFTQGRHAGSPQMIEALERTYKRIGQKMPSGSKVQTAKSTKGFVDLHGAKISKAEWKRIEEARKKAKEKGGNK